MTSKQTIADRPDALPLDACMFDGRVKFMESVGDDETTVPIEILARTDQPIEHWFWDRVVHDMDGMESKPVVPIDYCHSSYDILGAANKFETEGGLKCSGHLVIDPKNPEDRAREVVHKGRNGVPYEASIYFDPNHALVVETVEVGASVEVNGYTFEGPGSVIRKWRLKAVTICPHGADIGTNTKFSETDRPVPIKYTGEAMAEETTKKPAEDPKAQKPGDEKPKAADTKQEPAGEDEDTKVEPAGQTQEPDRVEVLLTKLQSLETMFDEAKKPKDPLDLLAQRIDELSAKFSGEPMPSKTDSQRLGDVEDAIKQIAAQFQHNASSSNQAADGTDGDPAAGDKPRWSDAFKFASRRSKN